MEINQEQLWRELETLATFSDVSAPAVTRVVFSPADLQARAYVKELCRSVGLVIREDAVGNTFARWEGREPTLPAVATGSHIDAIPNAGRYDGTVGVLGGLEAIRTLQRGGIKPRRSIELVVFTSEEPTRFGIGCLGSRLLSQTLDSAAAAQMKDRDGKTLEEVRRQAGFGGPLTEVALGPGHYSSFIELHIEQGPLLERARKTLGLVTAIAAPASLRILIEGEGGHAGAVLMPDRRDALVAAAEVVLAVERLARLTGAADTVATVGVCEVFPGAVNSIPSRVRLEVDVRDIDLARRDDVLSALATTCEQVGARRKLAVRHEVINADAPVQSDPAIVEALTQSAEMLGFPYLRMVSRAYHDSLFMSRIAPVAMLFIPCRGGVSHRPDEYASPEDIARGTLVLAQALQKLANE
ncbi:MAG TPA: M20 family metallo-hydrolase [Terriglobia bacterium]|nr:M20 family metallo-hydrolase [Terriglobia bacterium]